MRLAKRVQQALAQINPQKAHLFIVNLKKNISVVPYKAHTNIYRLYLYNFLMLTISSLSMSISKGNSMSVIIFEVTQKYSNIQTVQIRF